MTTGKEPVTGPDAPAPESAARPHALQTLSPVECLDLLGRSGVGRVAFTSAGEIMILPVNFAVTGKTIIFRTAPDTLLALHADAKVSFQVDRLDEARHEGWSVLVHGHAHRVVDELDVRRLEHGTRLEPWAAGARDVYVRIAPTQISGRRISADAADAAVGVRAGAGCHLGGTSLAYSRSERCPGDRTPARGWPEPHRPARSGQAVWGRRWGRAAGAGSASDGTERAGFPAWLPRRRSP